MKRLFMVVLFGLSICVPLHAHAQAYGPTAAKETLWSIASRLRPTPQISTQQMMLALYRANPHAFNSKNINSLKKGVYLQIPTMQQITQQNREQAIREAQRQNNHWQKTVPPRNNASTASNKLRQLRAEVKRLKQQLKNTQQRNRTLTRQLSTLRQQQGQHTLTADAQQQIMQLRTEIKDLKETLGEREDQIKTMRAALKNASESIKQQHAENQRIFEKLKVVSPESVPAKQSPQGNPQLKLSALNEPRPTEQQTPVKPAVWADEVNKEAKPAQAQARPEAGTQQSSQMPQPVTQLVNNTRNNHVATDNEEDSSASSAASPSKLSFIVALFSLIFILALLWRTFSQRRQTRNEEAAIRREVEAMNKPVKDDEHQTKQSDSDKKRQEPDIIF